MSYSKSTSAPSSASLGWFEKDVMILRQVVYKEIMEARRNLNKDFEMKATDLVKLTEADKKFIDKEIQWFLFGQIPDDIITLYALKQQQGKEGKDLQGRDLKEALTVAPTMPADDELPF